MRMSIIWRRFDILSVTTERMICSYSSCWIRSSPLITISSLMKVYSCRRKSFICASKDSRKFNASIRAIVFAYVWFISGISIFCTTVFAVTPSVESFNSTPDSKIYCATPTASDLLKDGSTNSLSKYTSLFRVTVSIMLLNVN